MYKPTVVTILAMWACAAHADESRRVRTSDLDLTQAAGVVRLDRRIDDAVNDVCTDRYAAPYHRYAAIACRRDTARTVAPHRAAAIEAVRVGKDRGR